MDIKELKKELDLKNEDIASLFNMTLSSFSNSSAKNRYETALCRFYELIKGQEPIKKPFEVNIIGKIF